MTARAINQNNRRYEERETPSGAPTLALLAVALFGLAILMLYISVATPQPGTGMAAIKNMMRGLAGSLNFLLPLLCAWGGALCVRRAQDKPVSGMRALADVLLLGELTEKRGVRPLHLTAAVLALLLALTLPLAVSDLAHTHSQAAEREARLLSAGDRGELDVISEPITPATKYSAYWPGDQSYFDQDIANYYYIHSFAVTEYQD